VGCGDQVVLNFRNEIVGIIQSSPYFGMLMFFFTPPEGVIKKKPGLKENHAGFVLDNPEKDSIL